MKNGMCTLFHFFTIHMVHFRYPNNLAIFLRAVEVRMYRAIAVIFAIILSTFSRF